MFFEKFHVLRCASYSMRFLRASSNFSNLKSEFIIPSSGLTLSDIKKIISEKLTIKLSKESILRIKNNRVFLDNKLSDSNEVFYGINTGFGSLCNVKISENNLQLLQENLVMSHACGTGSEVPTEIVKLMLFLKIQSLKDAFTKLKDISGLKKVVQFTIKEDINRKEYREIYTGLKQKIKEVAIPKNINSQDFNEFEEFMSNFDYLYTLFSEEYSASNNPKDIKKKQIFNKIKSNDYFSAIIYLSVKLEWILKEKFKFNGKLFEMINQLDKEIISNEEKENLHLLRKERNKLVHPNDTKITLDVNQLNAIVEIVFKEEMIQ